VDPDPDAGNQRFASALAYLKKVARERVADARREPQPHSLASVLLSAQREDATLTDEAIADELLAFLFAAHEPTAQSIALACAQLAESPRVQRRAHAHIDATLAGRTPETADLPGLAYATQIYDETLRLHPPRRCWRAWRSAAITWASTTCRRGRPC